MVTCKILNPRKIEENKRNREKLASRLVPLQLLFYHKFEREL